MQIVNLYKFSRPDGGVTVSPEIPDTAYTLTYRLIADEGRTLTRDGVEFMACVDTDSLEGWTEMDGEAGDSGEEISDSEALRIITGGGVDEAE